jgi:Flp pilus assembly CpaE family ATPase
MWTVLQEATHIVAVVTPDLPTLGSLKRTMPILQKLGGDIDMRLKVVLNRYHPDDSVTVDDIRTLLDRKVDWTLSNDYRAVIRAANEGDPLVLNGRSPYAEDISVIVNELVGGRVAGPDNAAERTPLRRILSFLQRR